MRSRDRCFNEAGAKSAGKLFQIRDLISQTGSFNEAGAKSAGKRARSPPGAALPRRFNEAGAKSAGKPRRPRVAPSASALASMRPAQKAPENIVASRDSLPELVRLQ